MTTANLPLHTINCGAARITLLSDGTSYWDGGGTFGLGPRTKWTKLLPPDDNNLVPQELRCVLIEADGQRMLVDCGVGNKPNELIASQYLVKQPHGSLMDDLARASVTPNDIDIVLLTHLHGDHAGWATKEESANIVPTFPNARYYVQRTEYADATHTNERTRNTYFPDNFVPLQQHGVLEFLDGDTQIAPSVRVVATPGHTAGHQSIIVQEPNARPVFLMGDMASYMIHFERLPWVTAYDVLPLITIETKRKWQRWAADNHAILISCHDTLAPTGTLVRNNKGLFSVVAA